MYLEPSGGQGLDHSVPADPVQTAAGEELTRFKAELKCLFDLDALELTGSGVPLMDGVVVLLTTPEIVLGDDGTVIYRAGLAASGLGALDETVWLDRAGTAQPVDPSWTSDFSALALSPDGLQVAMTQRTADGSQHIWIKQLDRGPLQRLTFNGLNSDPAWTPDGRSILFASERSGNFDIFIKPADGAANARLVLDEPTDLRQPIPSPDGEWLIYSRSAAEERDIMAKKLDSDEESVPIAATPGVAEYRPTLSPDGRWLAYVSWESGRAEVWVRAFPAGEPKWQISRDGGNIPRWGRSGRELLYRSGVSAWEMVSVEVMEGETFVRGPETVLFPWVNLDNDRWDVAPDDQRFFFVRLRRDDRQSSTVVVIDNFFEELKAKVGN